MKKILYICPYREKTGYGKAARENVKALTKAGYQVFVEDKPFIKEIPDIPKEHKFDKSKGEQKVSKVIYHVPVEWLPRVYINGIPNIVYTTFEADFFPPHWVELLNMYADKVCVPSEYNKKALINSGFTKDIFVIPHPLDVSEYENADENDFKKVIPDYVLKKKPYIFYNISQWSERKNLEALLKAYYCEFSKTENVILFLKTYTNLKENFQFISKKIDEIKKGLNFLQTPPVFLITSKLDENEIISMHKLCDCYVSLHRAEGFGLPIAEALAADKDIISVCETGEKDFLDRFDIQKVFAYKTPIYKQHILSDGIIIEDWSVQYNGMLSWYEADISQAREAMRTSFESKGKILKYNLDFLSHIEIGKKFKEVIE